MSWQSDLYLERASRELERPRATGRWRRFLLRWRDRLLG